MFYKLFLPVIVVFYLSSTLVYANSDTLNEAEFSKLTKIRSNELTGSTESCMICLEPLAADQESEDLVIVCGLHRGTEDDKAASSLAEPVGDIEQGLATDSRHIFHPSCLGEWIAINPTCPSCRAIIKYDRTYKSLVKKVENYKIKDYATWRRMIEEPPAATTSTPSASSEDRDRMLCERIWSGVAILSAGSFLLWKAIYE